MYGYALTSTNGRKNWRDLIIITISATPFQHGFADCQLVHRYWVTIWNVFIFLLTDRPNCLEW
jgi:hypothetical protein